MDTRAALESLVGLVVPLEPPYGEILLGPMTVLERSWLLWVMCIGLLLAPAAQAQTIHLLGGTGTAGFSGNGTLDEFAQFDTPLGISGDTTGALYIADTGNHLIRNIHDRRDTIVTVAGTAGTAGFSGDAGAATDRKSVV